MAQGAQRAQLPVRDQANHLDRVDLASMLNPTDLLYQNFLPRYERHPHTQYAFAYWLCPQILVLGG